MVFRKLNDAWMDSVQIIQDYFFHGFDYIFAMHPASFVISQKQNKNNSIQFDMLT